MLGIKCPLRFKHKKNWARSFQHFILLADKTPAGEAAWLGELSPVQQTGTQMEAGEAEVWQQSHARARKDT